VTFRMSWGMFWFVLCAVAIVLRFMYLHGSTHVHVSLVRRNLTDLNFGDLYNEDPFVADNSTKAWKNEGSGLTLEVVNALDDTWQDEFAQAVSDWDGGDPDSMTLTVTRGEVDYSCKEQDGVLKVCSANFGDTGWLGINNLLFIESTGEIISSVAKMNEYYLRNADDNTRFYTMCHEQGHGYGLPHT
jgi:hypothetical protein